MQTQNIFEENKARYALKTKADVAKTGLALIFGGGFISLFIVTAIIGIPMMLVGVVMLLISPFYKPKSHSA